MLDSKLETLIEAISNSPKYQHIHLSLIQRISAEEVAKGRKDKQTLKAIKNKLHQVGGAYLGSKMAYQKWLENLQVHAQDPDAFKAACRQIIQAHASTKERLPILEEFYAEIFTTLPSVNSILDIACGLNPLTIPWMNLAPGTRYLACDIYADMIDFLARVFTLLPVKGEAFACDVIAETPKTQVDLALILKTIPCLEQVDKHSGKHLLETINARYLLVSFPAKSLSGREKGMPENYEEKFSKLVEGKNWGIKKFIFETELAFLIKK